MSEYRPLREELECRILAMLNEELPPEEVAELERMIGQDSELAAYREKMSVLLGELGAAREFLSDKPEQDGPNVLSPDRRKQVWEAIGESTPEDEANARERFQWHNPLSLKGWNWGSTIRVAAAVILLGALLSAILIPSVGGVRKSMQKAAEMAPEEEPLPQSLPTLTVAAPMPEPVIDALVNSSSVSELPSRQELGEVLEMEMPAAEEPSQAVDPFAYQAPVAPRPVSIPAPKKSEADARNAPFGDREASWTESLSGGDNNLYDYRSADGVSVGGERSKSNTSTPANHDFYKLDKNGDDKLLFSDGDADAGSVVEIEAKFSDNAAGAKDTFAFSRGVGGFQSSTSSREGSELAEGTTGGVDPFASTAAPLSGDYFAVINEDASGQTRYDSSLKQLRDEMLKEVSHAWQRPKVYSGMAVDPDRVELQSITIPRVSFSGVPLSQVVETLSELSVEYDTGDNETDRGVSIVMPEMGGEDPIVNITLRDLSLDRILDFTTESVGFTWDQQDGAVIVGRAAVSSSVSPPAPLPEKSAADEPFSTFSLNVSDVSFKLADAALRQNMLPSVGDIRAEEFINAMPLEMPANGNQGDVKFDWELSEFPMAHNRQLLRFAVEAASTGRMPNQPANLVILVDCSGSMQRPDRQAILANALTALAGELTAQDRLSAVVFARTPRVVADGAQGAAAMAVAPRILSQTPEGGTNLESALREAYQLAQRHLEPNGLNRVILLTDGAANLGEVEADQLRELVIANRQKGIALDAFGVGWDGYNDELLEALTRNSNGRYAFLNSPETAAKDFADKLVGALNLAAADVKVQIEWNPQRVISYRQLGYEKHQLKTEDFRNNAVDAAELSAAEAGQALYVVQLNPDAIGGLGTLRVRYLEPSSGEYRELAWPLEYPPHITALDRASPSHRLAAAAALLADKLAQTPFAQNYILSEAQGLTGDLPPYLQTHSTVHRLRSMLQQARQLLSE